MTFPSFDEVRYLPLTTDEEVVERLEGMLDAALARQVWLMFLDAENRQLPVIMPTYVPPRPEEADAARVGRFIREVGEDVEAATVVLTYERRANAVLSPADRLWLATLRGACLESGLGFRGPYLCHRDGVAAVAPDDYL